MNSTAVIVGADTAWVCPTCGMLPARLPHHYLAALCQHLLAVATLQISQGLSAALCDSLALAFLSGPSFKPCAGSTWQPNPRGPASAGGVCHAALQRNNQVGHDLGRAILRQLQLCGGRQCRYHGQGAGKPCRLPVSAWLPPTVGWRTHISCFASRHAAQLESPVVPQTIVETSMPMGSAFRVPAAGTCTRGTLGLSTPT
jgi:hypothetical protein